MPPIPLSRRRFLGCSAAVGLALAGGKAGEAAEDRPVKVGVIGLGNRGTTLLRALIESPRTEIVALGDPEARHLTRGRGIVEKARGVKPDVYEEMGAVLGRSDVEAVVVALPCDLHARMYEDALRAGKHLYAEKPLGLTLDECDRLIHAAERAPRQRFHVGFQRRSNPRYQEAIALARAGEFGALIELRATWISSNGPVGGTRGWLASRERSGDWMVEQGVHIWDLMHQVAGGPPIRAFGHGRRDLFAADQPGRDVTDHYATTLEWADGFHASLTHSWIDPADDRFTGVTQRLLGTAGGVDLTSGIATFRDRARPRLSIQPGPPPNDISLAIRGFLDAIRSPEPRLAPISLVDARAATATALMVRRAVDERRVVTLTEVLAGSSPS